MRRRNFIAGLASTTAAWPVAARAQQSERVRRIGVLVPPAEDPEARTRLTTFRQALQGLGWTDGRNVHIDTRFAAGNAADLRKYAAELAALAPDVILAIGSAGLPPVLQATRTVPIVFVLVPDPVRSGFVHCCEGEPPDQCPEQSQGAAPERASPVHAVDTTGNALLTNFPLLQWSLYSRL